MGAGTRYVKIVEKAFCGFLRTELEYHLDRAARASTLKTKVHTHSLA